MPEPYPKMKLVAAIDRAWDTVPPCFDHFKADPKQAFALGFCLHGMILTDNNQEMVNYYRSAMGFFEHV